MKNSSRIIIVAGPTASGKSDFAMRLAQQFDGELICSDSMQVYRQFDIGTAKPTLSEQNLVPHHQLDLIDPNENYSAGKYERETSNIIQEIQQRDHLPILVGGTGLYYGISNIPKIPEKIRQELINQQEEHGISYCWEQLQKYDPQTAKRLHPNDTSRIMRSLEVVMGTGTSIVDFQQKQPFTGVRYPVLAFAFEWERNVLYERINQRTSKMLKSGWIEEVEMLLESYDPELKPLQAIGYREIVEHLQDKLKLEALVKNIQQRTRKYAKRQMTWFKREAEIEWHQPNDEATILDKIKVCLER